MNENQMRAIMSPAKTQEEVEAAFSRPRQYSGGGQLASAGARWLVILLVALDNGAYKWVSAVQIVHPKKAKIKPRASWTDREVRTAQAIARNELEGIGRLTLEQELDFTFGTRIERRLTSEEESVVLRPQLLGN